jgi:hypothetical protein
MREKGHTLPGTVVKITKSSTLNQPDTAHIAVEDGDSPVQEIHIKNTLETATGDAVSLKLGARVEVMVQVKVKDSFNAR